MDKLKLLSTIFSKLESLTKNNGQIIISRDSKSLYVDLEGERIEITDWIDIDTEENLLAILTPLTNKYYYTKNNNKIWRYINNDWECLNTSVNDLTPTYTESPNLVKLSSGEKLSVAFGKISKAITDLISHISDSVKHITSAERSNWNAAKTHADSTHAPEDAQKNVQSDWSATSGDAYIKNKPTEFPPSIHTHTKSEISDFPSSLPASGGNADTVNNHTVESDVPTDAVFTDTIYDDTEVKESIAELNSNLDNLSYGEQNGGKNLLYTDEFVGKSVLAENNIGGVAPTGNSITFTMSTTTNDDLSGGNSILYIIRKDGSNSSPVYPNNTLQLTDADRNNFANYRINFVSGLVGKTIKTCQIENGTKATDYEPYIPSVKMLADEVNAQQSIKAMDLKMLGWNVPIECPIQNYVDSDGVFHQRVGRVDLGSLEWTYDTLWKATSGVSTIKNLTINMYHSVYSPTILSISDIPTNSVKKADSGTLWINNGSSTEKPSGYLYFELAEEKTIKVDGNEAVTKVNESLSDYGLDNVYDGKWIQNGEAWIITKDYIPVNVGDILRVKCDKVTSGGFRMKCYNSSSETETQTIDAWVQKENIFTVPSDTTRVKILVGNPGFTPDNSGIISVYINNAIDEIKNDLAPKRIELQNVDERVTIQDNGSFIINGFAFVNLLVTFKETLQQWSNFVRLPRPKGGNVTVYCENSVKLTIYSRDNLPGDCGTYDIVQSGTEVRLLVNYEVA